MHRFPIALCLLALSASAPAEPSAAPSQVTPPWRWSTISAAIHSPSAAASTTGAAVRIGDTRLEVTKKRGRPRHAAVELLNPSCDGRYDVYEYAPRTEGDLAETVLICNNRVAAIKHSR